jgi:hypothetical protein
MSLHLLTGERARTAALGLVLLYGLAACGDGGSHAADAGSRDAGSMCTGSLSLDCSVAFMPTYPSIYQNLFAKTCGSPTTGHACHGPDGKQAGLVLLGMDTAYDALLGNDADHYPRVIPGDPECSILMRRLESDDPNFRMPLNAGKKLPEAERCAVRKWIANGAAKQ